MALNNPNTTAAAKFETEDETNVAAQTTQAAEQVAESVVIPKEEATTGAVTVAAKTSMALAAPRAGSPAEMIAKSNVLADLKDVMPVTWEDFNTIQANQGAFGVKNVEGSKSLGPTIELRLISHQDQFVSSPHDMDAEGEDLIKYSDDGIVAQDGTLLSDHQAALKAAGHDKAGIDHKIVLVGKLVTAGEGGTDLIGDLVQVVLPDTGRRSFNSHSKLSAFHIVEGVVSREDAEFVKLSAAVAGTGKKSFTKVTVGYADGHGKKVG